MATDFFARQDNARRQTNKLLVLFGLSVAAIIAAIYLLLAVGLSSANVNVLEDATGRHSSTGGYSYSYDPATGQRYAVRHRGGGYAESPGGQASLWQPALLFWVSAGTLTVIAIGSLYKIAELAAGGEAVAAMFGGRRINPQTTDLAERRLLNIVEEMALASGVPVPPVFVLDNESSINAFAAGHQPGDAVVAVSAGSLSYLTREELQGVIAHEFSHILNGDMRLNLRLIGVVNGILVLAIIGYYCMRSAGYMSSGSSRRSDGASGIFFLGLALTIFGYLGVFFGNLIKSAISRQREFLADASAVQFTRYPGGIAGALKKIGGLAEGSQIRDSHAAECSHMFFGNGLSNSLFNLFATHPPLDQRIRALEPDFDGRYPEVRPVTVTADSVAPKGGQKSPFGGLPGSIPLPVPFPQPAAAPAALAAGLAGGRVGAAQVTDRIGVLRGEQLDHAGRILAMLPEALVEAVREPFTAQAVIYALLVSRSDEATRARQLQLLEAHVAAPVFSYVQKWLDAANAIPAAGRLPLVDMAVPAIKTYSPQQYGQFRAVVEAMLKADGKIDLFEYCLQVVLFSYLDVFFKRKKPATVQYRAITAVAKPAALVLSILARVGHATEAEAEQSFGASLQPLKLSPPLAAKSECTLAAFGAALDQLAQASPPVKRAVVAAVTTCIAADGTVTLEESELLRAICAALGCPVPPLADAAAT